MARIACIVENTLAGGIRLTWTDGPLAFPVYELAGKEFTAAAEAARSALGSVVECYFSADGGDSNATSAARSPLRSGSNFAFSSGFASR